MIRQYMLLVKLPQDPDNLGNTEGWQIIAVTRDEEKSNQWEVDYEQAVRTGDIESFLVVAHSKA